MFNLSVWFLLNVLVLFSIQYVFRRNTVFAEVLVWLYHNIRHNLSVFDVVN